MLYSLNTLLLAGAIAFLPTSYATPLPHYNPPLLNVTSHLRSSGTKANATGIAAAPSPANTTPPPTPNFHPEVFNPSIYTIKPKQKRQIQYISPPLFDSPDTSAPYATPLNLHALTISAPNPS